MGMRPTIDARIPPKDTIYVVDAASLRVTNTQLLRSGEDVRVGEMPLALLRYLIANRQRIVPRQELKAYVWRATSVTNDAIDAQIKRVKERISEDPAQRGLLLKTYRGRGYRFLADAIEETRTFDPASIATDGEVYAHPAGWFERLPDGTWKEFPEYKPGRYFTFEEFSRDEEFIVLKDASRAKDPGRPMLLRLPIAGGVAQWGFPNPLVWYDFTLVQPKKKDSPF